MLDVKLHQALSNVNPKSKYQDFVFTDYIDNIWAKNVTFGPIVQRFQTEGNKGGKSMYSESLSIEYFISNFSATSIILECEVKYWIDYKLVDFIACLPNYGRVGVSVTRAMRYPDPDIFTLQDARDLLNKKLSGLIVARNAVEESQSFFKSILHIWAQTPRIAELMSQAYGELEINDFGLDVKGTLITLITVCGYGRIYREYWI